MVQRLCGICPVSHHLAAAKAMDHDRRRDALTPTAEKMRRLMHYGQILQSHALHFFHLSSPDLLFGFDSDAGQAQHRRRRRGDSRRSPSRACCCASTARRSSAHRRQARPRHRRHPRRRQQEPDRRGARRRCCADIDQMIAWSRDAVELIKRAVRAEPRAFYNALRRVPVEHPEPGARRRRDGPLPRRPARPRRRRQHAVRPRRLRRTTGTASSRTSSPGAT